MMSLVNLNCLQGFPAVGVNSSALELEVQIHSEVTLKWTPQFFSASIL